MKIPTRESLKTLFRNRKSHSLRYQVKEKNKVAPRGNSSFGGATFLFEERRDFMITKPKGCHDIYGIEAKKWKYIDRLIDEV